MLRALLCLAVLALSAPAAAIEGIATGEAPPPFTLENLAGREVALEDFRGHTTALLFWSTWSPRSVDMLEDFKGYSSRHWQEGLRIVAVNADGEKLTAAGRAAVERFANRMDLPFPVLLDRGLETYAAYGIEALPSAVILDAEGKVYYSLGGYPLFSYREELRDSFLAAMGKIPAEAGAAAAVAEAGPAEEAGIEEPQRSCTVPRSRYCLLSAEREEGDVDPAVMALRLALCRGDVAEAERMIRGIGPSLMQKSELRFALAHLMLLKGRGLAAEVAFTSLVEGHPEDSWGDWGLGLVALAEGRTADALDHMARAAGSGAGNAEAETAVLSYLLGFWERGKSAPGEEKFLDLFGTLAPIRDCYRKSDST